MDESGKYQQILEAAIILFSDRGFENTSIQDIAEMAEVGKGTVYLYFRSKEDLVKRVYEHCYEMDIKACDRGVEKETNSVDKLCLRMDNIIDYLLTHPREARIEQMYKVAHSGQNHYSYYQEEMYEAIGAVVKEGIEKGELRDMPAMLLARIYYGIADGLYRGFRERPELWEQKKIRDQCHQLIRDSMTAERK